MSGLHVTQHIMTPHYANTKNNDSALYKQTKLLQLVQKLSSLTNKQHKVDIRISVLFNKITTTKNNAQYLQYLQYQ